ncbi:MAG TPA: hypothetical protein VEJ68_02835 [Candidatus Bathyarchaeia archaeon]|nr:hypothetical protein [Candidatus Bathyarchaeia archaeon]
MSEPNYAGNIIVNLANLPEFLRKPILQKRLTEFFSMSQEDRREIINNALQAGPTIQFDKFSTLFKTWLEILCNFSEEQRTIMFTTYLNEIVNSPQKIISFNLDGIFEIYLSLTQDQQNLISATLKKIINSLPNDFKKRLYLIIPERARKKIDV